MKEADAPPEDMPAFFKILLGNFSKQLLIPPAFAHFFNRKSLPLKIKLQNSEDSLWHVNVVKIDNSLFFKKGWKDFVKDNSLELGDFVVFTYVGRSVFTFNIFGKNACEKDVNAGSRDSDKFVPSKGMEKERINNQQTSKDSVLDNEGRNRKMSDEDQRGQGRMLENEKRQGKVSDKNGSNYPCNSKINDEPVKIKREEIDEEVDEIPETGVKRKRTESQPSVPCTQFKDKEVGGSKVAQFTRAAGGSRSVKSKDRNGKQPKVFDENVHTLSKEEKALALQRAKQAFKSSNPYTMVAMQPSYIGYGLNKYNTNISLRFVEKYLNEDHNDVILQLPGGKKSWPMKCYIPKETGRPAKLCTGWQAFSLDNNLVVGDVCVFELINRTENIFRVTVFKR